MTHPCVCFKQHQTFRRRILREPDRERGRERERAKEREIELNQEYKVDMLFPCGMRWHACFAHCDVLFDKKNYVSLEINDKMKNGPLSLSLALLNG